MWCLRYPSPGCPHTPRTPVTCKCCDACHSKRSCRRRHSCIVTPAPSLSVPADHLPIATIDMVRLRHLLVQIGCWNQSCALCCELVRSILQDGQISREDEEKHACRHSQANLSSSAGLTVPKAKNVSLEHRDLQVNTRGEKSLQPINKQQSA